MTVPAT